MGYLVTILRTKKGVALPIDLEEVRIAIKSLDGWQFVAKDNAFVKENGTEDGCILWHENGELWAKTPSSWALEQMIALAKPLNARVRGDEFETYKTIKRWYTHQDDLKLKQEAERDGQALLTRSLRAERLIGAGIIAFFVLLGIVGYFIGVSFEKR